MRGTRSAFIFGLVVIGIMMPTLVRADVFQSTVNPYPNGVPGTI